MTLYQIKSLLPKKLRQRLYFLLPILNRRGEKKMRQLFAGFIKPGDLVFDIGTNVGAMTECFLGLGARVVCLEPHPESFAILAEKFKNNPMVTLVNKGAADSESELEFFISKTSNGISSFSKQVWQDPRFTHLSWDSSIKVKTTTLDLLIKEFGQPSFCKIDVEGYELQVLEGLTGKIKTLSFEISENYFEDLKLITKHLDSLGRARYNFAVASYYELELKQWVDSGQLFLDLKKYMGKDLYGDMYVRFD